MKKVLMGLLTLLLALMMSVAAFAAPSYSFAEKKGTYGKEGQMMPGNSYRFALSVGGDEVDITTKDFKLEKEIYDGKKYIDSIGLAGDCVYLKTIDTYAVNMDDPAEIDVDITLTARRDITSGGSTIVSKGDEFSFNICYDFGLNLYYVEVEEDDPDNASTYAVDEYTAYSSDGDRGWVNFDCGDIDVLMIMPRNGTVTFGADDATIEAVEKLYKPTGGTIEFVSFNVRPKISGTATLTTNSKYQYVYSYDGSALTPVKTTESGRYRSWTVTDGTLGTYVLTTKAMPGSSTAAQESSAAPSSSSAAPVQSSSAAPVQSSSAAPAPSSSAAPAPSSSEPEESSAEEVEEPVEAPESSKVIEEKPQEPEEEPAGAEVKDEGEKNSSGSFPTILVVILAVAIVAAVLIALLISKLGGSRR